MKNIIIYPFLFIIGMLGFVFFISFPKLFVFKWTTEPEHLVISSESFFSAFSDSYKVLTTPTKWTFIDSWMKDEVMERYIYSLQIMGLSILFTIFIGCIIACFIIFIPYKWKAPLKDGLNFLEGLPDLFILFLLQMGIFTLYKEFGIKLFYMYGLFGAKPYFFPMVVISILPSLFFAQYLLKVMEEEMDKQYILLGRAKGLSNLHLFKNHLIRNIYPVVMIYFKTIIFMVLTNLVLVEHMFILDGYVNELYNVLTTKRNVLDIVFYTLMLLTPILFLEFILNISAKSLRKIRGVQL
ncbi:ABC transporter permease subunit [Peribacillus acanthi]|uniref:ABC transporter permease subunit n=1 Tax=Peribacillus acanthi TaxID=2171554 RepID=UPI000D3E9408|nr:ABC transporter permease subunit [Peribacillus acanthi]